jgi:hypothetical protein
MIAPRIASLVAALVLTASVDLFAQQEPPVAPGDRVRVTAPNEVSGRFVGTVMKIGADTCVLEVEGRAEALALPLASVTSLEVSRGRKSNILKGAGIGLLIGGAVGIVAGVAACSGDGCEYAGATVGSLGAIGAGVGLLIGTSAGASSSGELWEPVPLDQLRVTIAPHPRGGLAIRVSVAF